MHAHTDEGFARFGILLSLYCIVHVLYLYCTRNRSQTVVRGRLATSCCRRGRLVVTSCGGRLSQAVGRVFLKRVDVF